MSTAPNPKTPDSARFATLQGSEEVFSCILAASVLGLGIGVWDATSTEFGMESFFVIAGTILGWRYLGVAWVAWLPLGSGLYVAHRVAIGMGSTPPFVERDILEATVCIEAIFPAGIGLGLGSLLRIVLEAIFPRIRRRGLRRRFWPRTILGMSVLIAKIALSFVIIHWAMFEFQTIYAPRYSERRFQQIRHGMTAAELEGLLGPPLGDYDWQNGRRNWVYTEGAAATSNYCRRWVFIEKGIVIQVISDDWLD